jgi:hypothetical protein
MTEWRWQVDMSIYEAMVEECAAYSGCGHSNDVMLASLKDHIEDLDGDERLGFERELGRFLRDKYLSEEAIAKGYGLEDFMGFMQWMDRELDWSY